MQSDSMSKIQQPNPVQDPNKIILLDQRVNFHEAKLKASKTNYRLPTLKDFIAALKDGSEVYNKFKGNWYWIEGLPKVEISGKCRIDYEKCAFEEISEEKWQALPVNQRAIVWPGEGQGTVLLICGDADCRLVVLAGYNPEFNIRLALVEDESAIALSKWRATLLRLKRGVPK